MVTVLILAIQTAAATNYYVDASAMGSNSGTFTDPWKSIDDIPATINFFQPGDTIFIKRGHQYTGTLSINSSGADGAPIVFMPYGPGNAPVLQYNLAQPADALTTNRMIIRLNQADHIVIDGFELTDATIPEADHGITANVAHGVFIYSGPDGNYGSHNVIKNLTISRLASGISIDGGRYNTITNCTIRNMRIAINTSWPNWDDHGAVGITLGGSDNIITHNTIQDCWANSFDYQYDGGAIEAFGAVSNNTIMYNTITNNLGVMEFGSNTGSTAGNNKVAYNLLINNGHLFWINTNNGFGVNVSYLQFYNNNVIETVASRLPDVRNLIGISSTPSTPNTLLVKNNIFWIATPMNVTDPVAQPFNGSPLVHQNNIYYLNSGSLGYALDASERMIPENEPPFTDIYSYSNPIQWNLTLNPSGVAVDFGQHVGIDKDFYGNLVVNTPDAGFAEYGFNDILPLQFITAKGWAGTNGNVVEWEVSNDPANRFEIERSEDGNSFEKIAEVPYNTNSVHYEYTDKDVPGDVQFYRIKVIEPDNSHSYSQTIIIRNNSEPGKLVVYPNPVKSDIFLKIPGTDFVNKEMVLVNSAGVVVKKQPLNVTSGQVKLNLGMLPNGMYVIRIIDRATGRQYTAGFTKVF